MSIFGLLLQPKQKRMIFYFSGTGNSKWVARQVAAYQHESLIAIADELAGGADLIYTLQPSEVVGFVFPVYSWAPPAIVMEFISKIHFTNAEGHYFFFVCTCGDEAGLTLNIMNESVASKGWTWQAGFTIIMPNNYVSFPGFDTDPKEVEQQKLHAAIDEMERINQELASRSNVFQCKVGSWAYIKSRIISKLFNKYQVTAKPFFATDDCISCGLCEQHCPVHNVKVHIKPEWGNHCTSCLACYHICPRHAIHYGKATLKKHQYFHPECK